GAHRDGAGDVLAGLEGRQALRGVIGDRAVDVDRVDVRVLEQVVVIAVALLDAELVAGAIEFGLVPAADGRHLVVRVGLVDGNELGPEPEADDGDANFPGHDGGRLRKRWRDAESIPGAKGGGNRAATGRLCADQPGA